jgi:enoyl-CoA hydratase/carnithine racemase
MMLGAMEFEHVLVGRSGDFATVTMNRPQRRNALSLQHMRELIAAFSDLAGRDVPGIVLAGNGPVFSAGHDFAEVAGADLGAVRSLLGTCTELMTLMQQVPQPVVARVHGLATAAGCQLVASCDLAIASEAATFATPGVDIGLFCSTPMVALSRNVPRKQAMEMLLTGEPVGAARARDIGLVNHVVAAGIEREAAIALARKVALKSAYTVKLGKAAFYRQAEMSLAEAYRYAAEVMTENMMARDAEEGIGAFIEKREPKWQDR